MAYSDDPGFAFNGSNTFVTDGAVVILGEDNVGAGVAAILGIDEDGIAWQINAIELVFEEARFSEWVTPIQEPNTRGALADAKAIYVDWAAALNTHDPAVVLDLYGEDERTRVAPVVADLLARDPAVRFEDRQLSEFLPGRPPGPALYFAASPGDRREVRAVGIYTLPGECPHSVAATWTLDRGQVIDSGLLVEVESLRRCGTDFDLTAGRRWWNSVTPPEPAPLILTGSVADAERTPHRHLQRDG